MTQRGWTAWESGLVLESDHMTAREIGEQIGRTEGAVRAKRLALRNGREPIRKATEEWTAEEDAAIIANPYLSAPKLGMLIGRSKDAVGKRRMALRARGVDLPRSGNSSPFSPGSRTILAKTCPDCGLLLQAKWFMVVSGAWRRRCTRCHSARYEPGRPGNRKDQRQRSKASFDKYQAVTIPLAENNGQPWTEADFTVLSDPDLTILQKALMLKRTYSATASVAHHNGFKNAFGLGDPERDQWIIDNPNAMEYAA